MYITVEGPCNVEYRQAENDANEGQYSCGDIHDKRPFAWPLSGVHLPFEIESSDKFPSTPSH
jgi:hypothetical protein